MPCTVCNHNQFKDIDRALLAGASLASLSRRYGLAVAALQRHLDILRKKMARAQAQFQASLTQGMFFKLNVILELAMQTVLNTSADSDTKMFLKAGELASRIMKQMTKMDVQLAPELIYSMMASPKWNLNDNLLPHAFMALADLRESMAADLLAPCEGVEPEPLPDQASPAAEDPPSLETLVQEAAQDEKSRDLLRKVFPELMPDAQEAATPNHPDQKWEKSGKSTGNTPLADDFNELNQEDNGLAKNAGKSLQYVRYSDAMYEDYLREMEEQEKAGAASTSLWSPRPENQ